MYSEYQCNFSTFISGFLYFFIFTKKTSFTSDESDDDEETSSASPTNAVCVPKPQLLVVLFVGVTGRLRVFFYPVVDVQRFCPITESSSSSLRGGKKRPGGLAKSIYQAELSYRHHSTSIELRIKPSRPR